MNTYNGSIHHFDSQRNGESVPSGPPWSGSGPGCEAFACRAIPTVGSCLTESDYTALEGRWIDRSLADQAQLRRVDALTGAEVVGRKNGNYAGILIPYFDPESHQIREYRLRRDHPDLEYDSARNLKVRQKYCSPPGSI